MMSFTPKGRKDKTLKALRKALRDESLRFFASHGIWEMRSQMMKSWNVGCPVEEASL